MRQAERAAQFLDLHRQPGLLVVPNPWDAGTAKLLVAMGFAALATTSAGLAFSLGRPDAAAAVTRTEILDNARAIVEATDLPVSADLEGGFGERPEDCAETIRLAITTGLAGGSIEDATGRRDEPLHGFEAAVDRVRAAAEAAHGSSAFVLTARAENFLFGRPDLADTIRRLQAFQEAGADVLFAPGLSSLDQIRAVVSSVDRPVNVIMGLDGVGITLAQLQEVGVKRVSVGSSFARAALGAFRRAALEVRDQGTFQFARQAMPYAEANKAFGG
jgi:2-methylisocitrate lyase-like PEP mutase family enzyme